MKAIDKGDIVMKYTYIHSPTDMHLICCETHEKVYVDFPTTLELISIPNIVETREREAIERYELLKIKENNVCNIIEQEDVRHQCGFENVQFSTYNKL